MDKINICNIALGRIGVQEIERMDEASEPARAVSQYYDFVRQTVLRRFPWTFATRRVELALLSVSPMGYRYAYRYPADALMLRGLYDRHGLDVKHYKLVSDQEGRVLYTNAEKAVAEYTADVKETSIMDSQFIEAFSWKLAAEVAFKLTGNMSVSQNAVQAYNAYMLEAEGKDAAEDNEREHYVNRLALARFMEV